MKQNGQAHWKEYKFRDLNCKIENWPFSVLLIETFDRLTTYLSWFQTLASKVSFKYDNSLENAILQWR